MRGGRQTLASSRGGAHAGALWPHSVTGLRDPQHSVPRFVGPVHLGVRLPRAIQLAGNI